MQELDNGIYEKFEEALQKTAMPTIFFVYLNVSYTLYTFLFYQVVQGLGKISQSL